MPTQQALSSIPVTKVCPVCDRPEDVANYPENSFVQSYNESVPGPVMMHDLCRKKLGRGLWSR